PWGPPGARCSSSTPRGSCGTGTRIRYPCPIAAWTTSCRHSTRAGWSRRRREAWGRQASSANPLLRNVVLRFLGRVLDVVLRVTRLGLRVPRGLLRVALGLRGARVGAQLVL